MRAWLTRFKDWIIPQGLYARSLLLIVVPLVIVQTGTNFIFLDRHLDAVTRLLAQNIARDVAAVTSFWETGEATPEELTRFARIATKARVTFTPKGSPLPGPLKKQSMWGEDDLEAALDEALLVPYHLSADERHIWIGVRLPDGILTFQISRKQLLARATPLVLSVSAILSLLVLIAAAIFLRNQVRPLSLLAEAAERFGKGQNVPSFKLSGAMEVRRAAAAFNVMKERIARQMTQRMEMLAGISHDLRTPLTRMKLELALCPPSSYIEGLSKDVEDMQVMVEEFLAFARGDTHETSQQVNLASLLEEVAQNAQRMGHHLPLQPLEQLPMKIRPHAVKRALQNLVNNAFIHGNIVSLTVRPTPESVEIFVDDNGPGIPPEKRSDVFRPFYRLDTARNSQTGGVGLGLSIALDTIQGHGGNIVVEDSPLGGARLHVTLPR